MEQKIINFFNRLQIVINTVYKTEFERNAAIDKLVIDFYGENALIELRKQLADSMNMSNNDIKITFTKCCLIDQNQ